MDNLRHKYFLLKMYPSIGNSKPKTFSFTKKKSSSKSIEIRFGSLEFVRLYAKGKISNPPEILSICVCACTGNGNGKAKIFISNLIYVVADIFFYTTTTIVLNTALCRVASIKYK